MADFAFGSAQVINQTILDDTYMKAFDMGLDTATSKVGFFIDVLFVALLISFLLRYLPPINDKRHLFSDKTMRIFAIIEGNAYTFSVAASYTLFLMRHVLF